MKFLREYFKRRARAQMDKIRSALGPPLYAYLHHKYARDYDETTAMELAAAVTLKLGGRSPHTAPIQQFVAAHADLIERKLNEIKTLPEICQIISAYHFRRRKVASDVGVDPAHLIATTDELSKMGILLPEGQVHVPASNKELLRQIQEFDQSLNKF